MNDLKTVGFILGLGLGFIGTVRADVVQNAPVVQVVPPVTSTMTEVVPVAIPATVIIPVSVPANPPVPPTPMHQEREGDYYVVRGTIQLDRPRNALSVKDTEGNLTNLIYSENVHIYRRGQLIPYLDVNNGDDVTVRFKGI